MVQPTKCLQYSEPAASKYYSLDTDDGTGQVSNFFRQLV